MSSRTPEEVRWTRAIEQSAFGVWDLDPALDRVHYSPQWKARLGFPRIHAPDSSAFWRCRVHPDDFTAMFEALRAHLDGGASTYEVRFRLRSNGHGYRTMLSRGRVVARDGLGNAARMVGTMIDLSGTPASLTHDGLANEGPEPPETETARRPPFHAVLGASAPSSGLRHSADAAGIVLLSDGVGDLLDVALRTVTAAR